MKPAAFDYVRPVSLDEAIGALASAEGEAVPLAGGQSLLPLLGLRMTTVGRLVDIGRLEALRQVEETASHVVIGAAFTHAEIEDGRVPDPGHGLMRRMAARIAYRAVRNQGTIGGSIAMADPAADWPVCLIALDAKARIAGAKGQRTVPVAELIEDIYTTSLARDEIIIAFEIPRLDAAARTGVAKVTRKTGAFAMSLAVAVVNDGARGPRVVLSGAANKAVRLPATSALLQSKDASDAALSDAIGRDLLEAAGELDDYSVRLHRAVVLRAIAEARAS
jgi:carbon-monoxide dehydrogenase medium subunit